MIQSIDLSTNMEIMKINNDIIKLKASLNHHHHLDDNAATTTAAATAVVENNRMMKTSTVVKPTHFNDSL